MSLFSHGGIVVLERTWLGGLPRPRRPSARPGRCQGHTAVQCGATGATGATACECTSTTECTTGRLQSSYSAYSSHIGWLSLPRSALPGSAALYHVVAGHDVLCILYRCPPVSHRTRRGGAGRVLSSHGTPPERPVPQRSGKGKGWRGWRGWRVLSVGPHRPHADCSAWALVTVTGTAAALRQRDTSVR